MARESLRVARMPEGALIHGAMGGWGDGMSTGMGIPESFASNGRSCISTALRQQRLKWPLLVGPSPCRQSALKP